VRGKEPAFTSWKFRIDEGLRGGNKVKEWKYTIDFIFHSPNLKSTAVLEMPEEKEIDLPLPNNFRHRDDDTEFDKARRKARGRCLLPNKQCPSDHLPLVAEILLPQLLSG